MIIFDKCGEEVDVELLAASACILSPTLALQYKNMTCINSEYLLHQGRPPLQRLGSISLSQGCGCITVVVRRMQITSKSDETLDNIWETACKEVFLEARSIWKF